MPQQIESSAKNIASRFFLAASVSIVLVFGACSSKYTVKSSEYVEFNGEINRHVRLLEADKCLVFEILTTEKTFSEICPEGTIVTHESQQPYGEGSLVKTRIDSLFDLEWNSRVEEVIANRRIRLKFLDGFFSDGTEIWELEEVGQGTLISHTIIFQPGMFLKKLAWLFKVRARHDDMVEVFLDNLNVAVSSPDVQQTRLGRSYTPCISGP